ncbi:MAG: LLM class F420-dependent oxidoreductase [Acidimicrobiales bacterium]
MDLCIFTEPQQGASYSALLDVAKTAERCGYGAFFRSDHYLKMGPVEGDPGPTDAWVTLGALARETERIRLGTLLTAGTFRLPGPLAIAVAQIDDMSGGRVELGLGAGWYEQEHEAYGIPFPPLGERFERLGEQLEIISGLWDTPKGETYSFKGRHYTISDSPALPKPVQRPHPPLIVGGHGPKRTPALAARFAAEFNVAFASAQVCQTAFERGDRACEAIGRDPTTLRRSVAQVLCCGSDAREIEHRASRIGRQVEELADNGLAGTPEQIADKIALFSGIGATRMYLQVLDLADLEHLELVAQEVMPRLPR